MMNKIKVLVISGAVLASMVSVSVHAKDELNVRISPELESIEVVHMGEKVTIQRDKDQGHTIPKLYAKTSRACPPFCIQPSVAAPDVETIAELEMMEYLKAASTDSSVLVIDSRTSDWTARGTIPGSVNIPWTKISTAGEGAWTESSDSQLPLML